MTKHYCDICKKEILNPNENPAAYQTTGGDGDTRYKIIISAYLLPGLKTIELCEECIIKAIRGGA